MCKKHVIFTLNGNLIL